MITTRVFGCVFACIGMCLHVVAFYLLWRKHANISTIQKIILLNLSLVEMLICFWDFVRLVISAIIGSDNLTYESCSILFSCLILALLYVMAALTMDRFAQIYLNIKYDLYWSVRKTKYTIGIIWSMTILFAVLWLLMAFLKIEWSQGLQDIFAVWIMPVGFTLYLFFIIFTYTYITFQIIQTKRSNVKLSCRPTNESKNQSYSNVRNGRKIQHGVHFKDVLIPTLLISTYTIFTIFPVFIFHLMKREIFPNSSWFSKLVSPMFYLGCFSDAIICILFSTTLGKRIIKRINQKRIASKTTNLAVL